MLSDVRAGLCTDRDAILFRHSDERHNFGFLTSSLSENEGRELERARRSARLVTCAPDASGRHRIPYLEGHAPSCPIFWAPTARTPSIGKIRGPFDR
jgi:hypothetical protein